MLSDEDRQAPACDVLDFPHAAVDVVQLHGDHLIPLTRANEVAQAVTAQVGMPEGRYDRA